MKRLVIYAALVFHALPSSAALYSFSAITSNDPSGYAQFVGESQLYMDVTVLGLGQVSLVFTNAGPAESSISRIYFDYVPTLSLSLVAINDGNGVQYAANPTNPKNLPGGKSQTEAFISDLAVSSDNPSPYKGINPYESLELIMSYDSSFDFLGLLDNKDLRVGLHVISLGSYSESFVNVVPEPTTFPLVCLGSIALRWLRIKTSRAGKQRENFNPSQKGREDDELQWVEIHYGKSRRDLPLTRCEAAIRKVTT